MNENESKQGSETVAQLLEEINQLRTDLAAARSLIHQAEKNTELCDTLDGKEQRYSPSLAGDGLWDWNLETDDLYFSPRWKSMLGYRDDELENIFQTWEKLVHPDDHDFVVEKVTDYLEGRSGQLEVQFRMRHKNGQMIVVLFRGFLVDQDCADRPDRLIGTHIDMTNRIESETYIRATSDILEMIATRVPADDIYKELAHLYESRHPGIRCSMLTLAGNKLMHGGAPSLPQEYCKAINGVEHGPDIGSCGTATYYGKRVLVEDIATDPKWAKFKDIALPHGLRSCWSEPVLSSTGEVLGAFGMYRDYPSLPTAAEIEDLESAARLAAIIMEREKSEKELGQHKNHLEELVAKRTAELEEAKREAEEANLAKSQFLSSMSHELRTPLNAILGFSQILVADDSNPVSEEQKEGLDFILKSGEHLLQLINEILDLSQIETGNMSLTIEPVSLQAIIEETVSLVQSTAKKYQIEVTSGVKNDTLQVTADRLRLKQVLLNLLSNGIKYNHPGGKVNVHVNPGDSNHQIVVTDTGIGIEQKHIESLFEPFNRLGAETMDIEGTGIGLTITRRLTEEMTGTLTIESEPGKGSSFAVSFPADKTETVPADKRTGSESLFPENDRSIETETVLYVEDNPINVKLVQRIMKRCRDIRLVIARTGQEGIDMAESEVPSLILMDMHLPDMNGREAFKQIRLKDKTREIPVVGVSADAMRGVAQKSESDGLSDYITKPFNIDHFLSVIYTFVGKSETGRQSSAPDSVELPS